MDIKKDKFVKALEGNSCKGRILRLMHEFQSFEEFIAASKGDLMKAERRARPLGKHGLGDRFFAELDRVKASACYVPPPKKPEPEPPKLFTIGQLKAVTALMELCGIDRIDIGKIVEFLETMGAKV